MVEHYYIASRVDGQGNPVDHAFFCIPDTADRSAAALLDRGHNACQQGGGYLDSDYPQPITLHVHGPFVLDATNLAAQRTPSGRK